MTNGLLVVVMIATAIACVFNIHNGNAFGAAVGGFGVGWVLRDLARDAFDRHA